MSEEVFMLGTLNIKSLVQYAEVFNGSLNLYIPQFYEFQVGAIL